MTDKRPAPARPPAMSGAARRISDSEIWRLAGEFTQIVWRASADGTNIIAPTWSVVTGQTQDEIQAGGWLDRVHDEDRARVAGDWAEAIRCGDPLDTEFRLQLRDGQLEYFRTRAEPMRNRRGQIKGWIGLTTNIDEQKRAEMLAGENADRLRLIVDSADVGTLDWDLAADEIDVNPRGRELMGLPATAALSVPTFEIAVDPEDRSRVRSAIARALDPAGEGRVDVVFRVRHSGPDRQVAWISARGAVRFLEGAAPRHGVRLLAVLTDLTREVRELEDRAWLSTLVGSSNDAIIAKTPNGIITHWNAAAERIFGYAADEMLGQSVFRIVPPETAAQEAALLESARSGVEVTNVDTERLHKDGRRLIVALTLSPIFDQNGGLIGLSAIERDITADRLRDAQLNEAQKLEAVGQLAGGVAHDLNNILTTMMAGVHLVIEQGTLDQRGRARLMQVRDECFRASSVIRELLAFGRQQVVMPHACSLNDIVREAAPMLRRLVGEDIELTVDLRGRAGVFVDRGQLLQVIVSLAVHARDSMSTGGKLVIATNDDGNATDASARRAVLTMSDTGAGVTAETRARLFEPYFTTRKLGWGTGLGLSVVHGIVAQFGGTIDVDSEPGAGTMFTINLPAVEPPPVARAAEKIAIALHGSETVLLVEDERVLRDQLAEALRELGYVVLEARNGYDALTVLEQHGAPVHLIVSDVVMPEMSGTALVAQLREWYPNLRVLFMTGYSEEAVANYGVMVSNTSLLMKPFMVPELAARIRAVLAEPRRGDPAGRITAVGPTLA